MKIMIFLFIIYESWKLAYSQRVADSMKNLEKENPEFDRVSSLITIVESAFIVSIIILLFRGNDIIRISLMALAFASLLTWLLKKKFNNLVWIIRIDALLSLPVLYIIFFHI